MTSVTTRIAHFLRDESGAALLEYTVLIGLILSAVMVAIASIATWVGDKWTTLNSTLSS